MLIGTTIVRASLPTRVISCPSNENRKSRSVVSYINVLFFFFLLRKTRKIRFYLLFEHLKLVFFLSHYVYRLESALNSVSVDYLLGTFLCTVWYRRILLQRTIPCNLSACNEIVSISPVGLFVSIFLLAITTGDRAIAVEQQFVPRE